eukprot:COSAG02_NODE_59_length_43585_cov_39.087752_18_plen_81_part_00
MFCCVVYAWLDVVAMHCCFGLLPPTSSTVPQFCWFLTKSFHTNKYYSQELYPAWLAADMKYWQTSLNQSSTCWGSAWSKF